MAKDDTPKELLQALDMVRETGGPQLESLDSVEARHVDRVRRIFADRNIVGIGISEKESEGKPTGHLGLTFYVEKKLPKTKITTGHMIPPVMSVRDRTAVFTDVQQIGHIVPQVNRKTKPIQSGFSIGNRNETGTLGAIVKKGAAYYLLSNSHVLADSGKGKPGDAIYYPGDADRGSAKLQQIGTLSTASPFTKSSDFVNRVDAALAKLDKTFAEALAFSIYRAKVPFETIEAARGMKVAIRGRTSGNREGTIKDVHFSAIIPYPGVGKLEFIDQILCTRYSAAGDSGSLVVDKKSGKIVGLHVAGSPEGSVSNHISDVMKALKFRFADA